MSNLAWQRTEDDTPREEITPLLKEMGSMSSELVDNMLDIVWSVDPKQDSVGSVISRLQAFYQRVHSASEISVNWKVEEDVRRIALPPRSRRNLYLIMKEAINNAIKHSGASTIDVAMTQDLVMLHVVIQDYGKGFDVDNTRSGYGLSTMSDRAKESGAAFELRSASGTPTTVYVKWPLRKYGRLWKTTRPLDRGWSGCSVHLQDMNVSVHLDRAKRRWPNGKRRRWKRETLC